MLELSKFFSNDIVSDNLTLKPVILITDPETNNVLFTLTQDKDELLDRQGNKLEIINCISKVSNVRLSTDYDTKTLKINRLRCTLYNYYDVRMKLSEYIDTSITNKNFYMFYKSPTTNIINDGGDIGDYDCALIYKGQVSRIEFNNDSISISAEDSTQVKISNKKIPYMSSDRLPEEIRNNLTEEYKNKDNLVVPMTFGKVDKAPTITYYSNDANELNVLLDTFPTYSRYKTSKIPYMLNNYGNADMVEDFFLYCKEDDDYIIVKTQLNQQYYYDDFQYNPFSRFTIYSQLSENNSYVFPELSEFSQTNEDIKSWSYIGLNTRQAIGAVASTGTIWEIENIEIDDITNTDFSNEESLTNNGNLPKIWYREGDFFTPTVNFSTGYRQYANTTDNAGAGRWIIFRMERGSGRSLYNTPNVGSTFLLSDWEMYKQEGTSINIPEEADRVGWFVSVISSSIFKNIESNDGENTIMNRLFVLNDDQMSEGNPNTVNNDDPYETAPIYLLKDENSRANSTYYGQFSNAPNQMILRPIMGYKYGNQNIEDLVMQYSANEESLIAVFEYFPKNWANSSNSYSTNLKMNNLALLHQVHIENLSQEEIFTSIQGRKNHLYTQQIDPLVYQQATNVIVEDIPFSYFKESLVELTDNQILERIDYMIKQAYTVVVREEGEFEFDPEMADFDLSNLEELWDILTNQNPPSDPNWFNDNNQWSINPVFENENWNVLTYAESLDKFATDETWSSFLSTKFNLYLGNPAHNPLIKNYSLFKKVFNMFLVQMRILNRLGALRSDLGLAGGESPPFDNFFANSHQFDNNYTRCLFNNTSWLRGFFAYAYEYILQKDFDFVHDYQARVVICTNIDVTYDPLTGEIRFKNENRGSRDIDITDKIASYKQYNWNDFNINTWGDWVNNFNVYMDDLVQAFSRALLEDYQDAINDNNFIEWNAGFSATGEWIPRYEYNMNEWANSNQWVLGSEGLDPNNYALNSIKDEIGSYVSAINSEEFQQIAFEDLEVSLYTDGVISKPSDIVMNILTNELGYGKYDEQQQLGDVLMPDYTQYDMPSIIESRALHSSWKMGFSVNKKIDGKKLIQEILSESKSYPHFNNDGRFGLINIKNNYTSNDIDKTINEKDILSYKFSITKREDIITSCKMFYKYDYGHKNYTHEESEEISNLLPNYYNEQTHNYHLTDTDGHSDINLKYHSDKNTVNEFLKYKLLNNCNSHNLVQLKLPLSYMDLTVSDIIHIPLINNEKIFNIDYSVVDFKNTQPIYPLWVIMETNLGVNEVSIKAYQLHYLGTDGEHGFV